MIYKAVVLRERFFRISRSVWDSTRFIKLILLHHVRHRVVSTNGRKERVFPRQAIFLTSLWARKREFCARRIRDRWACIPARRAKIMSVCFRLYVIVARRYKRKALSVCARRKSLISIKIVINQSSLARVTQCDTRVRVQAHAPRHYVIVPRHYDLDVLLRTHNALHHYVALSTRLHFQCDHCTIAPTKLHCGYRRN